MALYFIADGATPTVPIVYCKELEHVQDFVDGAFHKYLNLDPKTTQILWFTKMPDIDDKLPLCHFCVETRSDDKVSFELYQCSNKEYGWIRSDIRKRVKKLKEMVSYQIHKYPNINDTSDVKVTTTWIDDIKDMLVRVNQAVGVDNKKQIALELFEYIYQHKDVVLAKSEYFNKSIKDKLVEFYYDNQMLDCKRYYEAMFSDPFPTRQ